MLETLLWVGLFFGGDAASHAVARLFHHKPAVATVSVPAGALPLAKGDVFALKSCDDVHWFSVVKLKGGKLSFTEASQDERVAWSQDPARVTIYSCPDDEPAEPKGNLL